MVTHGHHGHEKVKERISCEQFVKAGKEVLKLFTEPEQHKYYFKLFSQGKDHLTREGKLCGMERCCNLVQCTCKTVWLWNSACRQHLLAFRSLFLARKKSSYYSYYISVVNGCHCLCQSWREHLTTKCRFIILLNTILLTNHLDWEMFLLIECCSWVNLKLVNRFSCHLIVYVLNIWLCM